MKGFNARLSFPLHESLNHDLTIRRFCLARLEQEQGGGRRWRWRCRAGENTPSEVDEFVDSFINMDHCIGDNDIESMEKQQSSSSIEYSDQDGIETFSMVDDLYGVVLIMMEAEDDHVDMSGLVDDFPVSKTKMRPRVEEVSGIFAHEIRNIVTFEGSNRIERHERADQWIGRAGFQETGLKCTSQARMMLSVYGCEGYTSATEKDCLLLGWKGRPIMLASAWQARCVSSS
ncbi:DELLA protein RGL1-like [Pyrus ussuriensis x Pyrus communis]|uniref:DELLA protein RGL1-like n=1 Tax=Pyrus ussuriensis x Pyrus communis TaxID=2448454 RepID=A0A5N5FFJ5_9ROSA|nr:DELLA protein RGL1-like [Pyrus ussuriensis x Pyrus communis]